MSLKKDLEIFSGYNIFFKLMYIAALDCDLRELPVIQGILSQIKQDNQGFFAWPTHRPSHVKSSKK